MTAGRLNRNRIFISSMAQPMYAYQLARADSLPRTVNAVYAPAHELALRPEQESDDGSDLLCRALSAERARIVKRRILRPACQVPVLLHQGRINRSRSHSVDADLAVSILLRRHTRESDNTMLAGVIGSMVGETCRPLSASNQQPHIWLSTGDTTHPSIRECSRR